MEAPVNRRASQAVSQRDQLRRATQTAHAKAEARWFRMGSFANRSSYDTWLSSLFLAHARLGAVATKDGMLSRYGRIEAARKSALLSDLEADYIDCSETRPVSASWSWGVLYALHGSSLGASVLLKTNAIDASWPRRYLEEMRGFATSGQLSKFFRDLNATPANTEEMVAGANAVFDLLAANN